MAFEENMTGKALVEAVKGQRKVMDRWQGTVNVIWSSVSYGHKLYGGGNRFQQNDLKGWDTNDVSELSALVVAETLAAPVRKVPDLTLAGQAKTSQTTQLEREIRLASEEQPISLTTLEREKIKTTFNKTGFEPLN